MADVYPWKKTRMSPSISGMNIVSDYMKIHGTTSILEFGAGYSTWVLHKLNFKIYVAIETFPIVIDRINSLNLSNFVLLQKWDDIPNEKYQYVFLDSHVGGNVGVHDRHAPLEYALEHNLLSENVKLFAHDYIKIKRANNGKNPHRWARWHDGWFRVLKNYNFDLLDEINNLEFGIYGIKK